MIYRLKRESKEKAREYAAAKERERKRREYEKELRLCVRACLSLVKICARLRREQNQRSQQETSRKAALARHTAWHRAHERETR